MIQPVGFTSTVLPCPVDIQLCYDNPNDDKIGNAGNSGNVNIGSASTFHDNLTDDKIQQISTALTGQSDQITGITNQTSNMISLGR